MSKTKAIPSSQISLLSKVPKCRCMCFYAPGWNIPPISNLYPADDQSKSIPLTSVMLNGTISNSSASISFAQTFKNDSESPIECIYKFPSDYSFAVVGLSVKVGDKTIEAEVMEKKQAEEKYDDAVAAGHTAVKLNYDEKLPDIIELNIGQLQPGDTAEICVKMVCELEVIKHGFFSLIFPLDFFPRYGAEEGLKGERGSYLPAEFGAEFNIKSSSVITNLDVSHEGMRFEQSEDGREVRVTMDASKDIVAKDIVISYSTEQIREPQLVLTKCDKYPNKVAAHISFIPRSSEEHEINEDEEAKIETPTELDDHDDPEVANGEFIFILDRSGSMGGSRIKAALAALELFIRSIPPNSKFNVISFGSTYQLLYEKSVEYNNANMENAIKEIKIFSSDLGGTELYSPINYALSLESDHQCPRNVFVLTDGDISDTQSVLNKIREFNHHTRVHSFGIGSGASIFLVKEIAKEGKGSSTLVADNDPHLNAKVIKALKKASKPAFTNISVDWMENKHNVRLSYPKPPNVPYIYEEEPFHFYAILSENDLQESNFTLTFYDTLNGTEETLVLKVDPNQIIESNEGQDFQMTAKHYLEYLSRSKEKIDDSEIVSISVEYSVLSSKTAFFGKIKNSIKSTEEMKTIEIPVKKLQKESLIIQERFRCLSSNVSLQRNVMLCDKRSAQIDDLVCKSENLSMQSKQFKREAKKSSPGIFSKIGSAIGGLFGSKKSKAAPYESSCAVQRDNSGCRDQIMECMDECMDICDSAPMSSTSSTSSKKKKESEASSSSGYMEIAKYQDTQGFFSDLPSKYQHLLSSPIPDTIVDVVYDKEDGLKAWTTILAICILKKEFKDSEDEWTLITKKAETYLKSLHIKNVKQEIKNAMKLL